MITSAPLRLLACVLTFALVSGCQSACLQLTTVICNCQPDLTTQQNCQQQAQNQVAIYDVRPQDEAFCQHQLDTNACICQLLTTEEGRARCGLSWTAAPPDGGMAAAAVAR